MYQPAARSKCQPMLGSITIGNNTPSRRTSFIVSVRSMFSIVTTNRATPVTMAASEITWGTVRRIYLGPPKPRRGEGDWFSGIRRSTITTSRHVPSSWACFS